MTQVEVNGYKMILDPGDCLALAKGSLHEPTSTRLVKEKVKEGDIVLDLGANIGYYTLLFSRLVGDKGKVIAFEPAPESFELLVRNVRLNNCQNVEVHKAAVSDRTGGARLFLNQRHIPDHRLYDSGDGRKSIDVWAVRLDDLDLERIDFIKMDIQGAEWKALRGMLGLIDRNPSVKLLAEFWPWGMDKCTPYGARCFLGLLKCLAFEMTAVDDAEKATLPITSTQALLETYGSSERAFINLYCERQCQL